MSEIWTEADAAVLAGDLTMLKTKGGDDHAVDHLGVVQGLRPSVPIIPGCTRIDAGRPGAASAQRRWTAVGAMLGAGIALLCITGARMVFDVVRCFV